MTRIEIRLADLGEDVIYAVHRTPTRHLVVINTRVSLLDSEDPQPDGDG